jgi:hypothetical protein
MLHYHWVHGLYPIRMLGEALALIRRIYIGFRLHVSSRGACDEYLSRLVAPKIRTLGRLVWSTYGSCSTWIVLAFNLYERMVEGSKKT